MKLLRLPLILSLLALLTGKLNAQVYSSDDILVDAIYSATHDSTYCHSIINIYYVATIENSYVGDIVKVKDQTGNEFYQTSNATGQNPWTVTLPFIMGMPVSDEYVMGGNLFYPFQETKITTSHDTLYGIQNFIQTTIPDACSFSTVGGRVFVDNNSNCQYDSGDDNLSALTVDITETLSSPVSSLQYPAYTQADGTYLRNVQSSWFVNGTAQIPGYLQFAFGQPACAPGAVTFNALPASNVDFPLLCTSDVDLEATILSEGRVRPNLPFLLFPSVANTGCEEASGTMKLVLHPEVTYDAGLSANPATSVSGDTLIWNYSNLTNISTQGYWNSFIRSVHLTPSLNVNIGDTLCFTIISDVQASDINPSNNVREICLPVVNSYDPNIKESEPKGFGYNGYIAPETEKLKYTIHFQNTGNDVAFNIHIIDTLEENVLPSTMRILGSSHYMQPVWLSPNVVKFQFPNINLLDSTTNEPASHGAVSFEIDLVQDLAPGTQIMNTAHIFFDFNPAIVTNTALNTIAVDLGLSEKSKAISVYPNPASTVVFVKGANAVPYELITISGQKVSEGIIQNELNISTLKEGIYLLKMQTKDGLQTERIVVYR